MQMALRSCKTPQYSLPGVRQSNSHQLNVNESSSLATLHQRQCADAEPEALPASVLTDRCIVH